ncbi:coiled-coil domain-containing protein 121 isoform X1 [Nycticebus coucang]|uniref:coiled-coil domain-containing protein 121 isoform X1 n=2 Tax=Nycticebus coucang TaxID=9470 RepID=UPI00234CDC44|nr:coiled-coil domain-containing protein 121 isoform X1 [Nycticebus coucang]
MRSQGQGSHSKKTGSVPRPRSGATGKSATRGYSVAEALRAGTGARCHPQSCWAAPRHLEHRPEKLRELSALERCSSESRTSYANSHSLAITPRELDSRVDVGDERLDSRCKFAEGLRRPPPPYCSLINNFFEPQNLTKVKNFKEKTLVEMRTLNKQIKQAQIQQKLLQDDNEHLHTEKLLVQAENKLYLEYLNNKAEDYRNIDEKLWNTYLQKCGEIQQRRQEVASRYEQQTSALKTKLLEKEKIQSYLKQQLQDMRNISTLKEMQELEIQTLQEKERKVRAEIVAEKQEVQVQLAEEFFFLGKQLSELDLRQLGKRKLEHKSKIQALELAAKESLFEFSCGLIRENQQLRKKLLQLIRQPLMLEASQSHLKSWKQQLQQEQWYLEYLTRGRQRLQGSRNWCLKEQDAPQTASSPPLGTKSRIDPQ